MLIEFWNGFSKFAIDRCNFTVGPRCKSIQYKDEVINLLQRKKDEFPLNNTQLRALQVEIEDLTMSFDEKSLYKSVQNVVKLLIRKKEPSAKDFLKTKLDINSYEYQLVTEFGQYTIEALLVHTLGALFSAIAPTSMVRIASLIERVDATVRAQALLIRRGKDNSPLTEEGAVIPKVKKEAYAFGTALVQFMLDRGLLHSIDNPKESVPVNKKKGKYYIPQPIYVACAFDPSSLPLKLSLPMVFPPLDWECDEYIEEGPPNFINDFRGGYLCKPTSSMIDRYSLLSSADFHHFYIDILNVNKICSVMNKLQSQPFEINSEWLQYLMDNEEKLVDQGLLYPRFISYLSINDASSLLREYFLMDEKMIKNPFSFSRLFDILCKDIQRARYEEFLIKLANAYDGYKFYLPAFLDFRGRIYRSGVLHFHERDLARSLILIGDSPDRSSSSPLSQLITQRIIIATAFHYKSFNSYTDAGIWLIDNLNDIFNNKYKYGLKAKRPFQFLANVTAIEKEDYNVQAKTPITQDASASAYQLMSYFLLDVTIGSLTNLTPDDSQIHDIYEYMLGDLKEFLPTELDGNLSKVVCDLLTRKIVKGMFMPLIYGKTLMSIAQDLKEHFSHYITHKECFAVAKACLKYWRNKLAGVDCLMRLISHIGWMTSARARPVKYYVPYFVTIQEYMIKETLNISVYDRVHKKRRRVSMKVSSSSKSDCRKSAISTFVNFIHQRDAYIAMSVVDKMLQTNGPIYTVHDNFITTPECCGDMPYLYSETIREMGPPLLIINELIYVNIITPLLQRGPTISDLEKVISKEALHHYLTQYKPTNINKQKMATWDERINGILAAYAEYTRIVCADPHPSPYTNKISWTGHVKKWLIFREMMDPDRFGRDARPTWYYCLHY